MKYKIFIVILLILAFLTFSNNYIFVTRYEIPELPKIVHITDVHNGKSFLNRSGLLSIIEKESPDYIFISGDLVDSRKPDIQYSRNLCADLVDIAPVYYVTGNHESRMSQKQLIIKEMESVGVNCVNNQVIDISENIIILGLDDLVNTNQRQVNQDLLSKLDENKINLVISHRPEIFETYASYNANYIFTGHAHGGQVQIPFIGGLVAPNQGFFPKYHSGEYVKNDTKMFSNRGIGNSIIPFRVFNQPEVVVIN